MEETMLVRETVVVARAERRRAIRTPSMLTMAVLISALIVGLSFPGHAGAQDLSQIRAQSKAWMLDLRSGQGFRVAGHQWTGQEDVARSFPRGYSPQQIRQAYGFDQLFNDGDGQVIGIVIAYDHPTAAADLQHFIDTFWLRQMFGLPGTLPCTVAAGPHPCFQIIFATGSQPPLEPPGDGGVWGVESVLDIEWAHAIAQGADIALVEATDDFFVNLLPAVDVAVAAGASIVSMSFGATEVSSETVDDPHFNVPDVTFVASSGDSGHLSTDFYPAVSPFVLGVGGTTLHLDWEGHLTAPETAWSFSSGGISIAEPEPGYQSDYPIPPTDGFRGSPDVAFNADPTTGQAVYDTETAYNGQTGWLVVAGTSIAAPQWAGLTALANELRHVFRAGGNLSSNDLIHRLQYGAAAPAFYHFNYRDITSGSNGTCGAICDAGPGYDFVTGLGTPLAKSLVWFLALPPLSARQ